MSWNLLFECGCIYPYEDCTRKWIRNARHYICPKHPKKIMIKRITVCEYCLKEFEFNQRGNVPEACPICRKRKTYSSKNVSLVPLNHPDIQANMERSDCASRSSCLVTFAEKKFLPCRTCEQYVKEEIRTQTFTYNGDFDNFYI